MTVEEFTLTIDEIVTIASEILAMEKKNQKRWNKNPSMARGEDLAAIISSHFPKISDEDLAWTALWVDVFIHLQDYRSEKDEYIALLSAAEATEAFLKKTEEDLDYFSYELDWVAQFGCLLTEGRGSDIGAWFFDPMWDRLYEIEAIVSFDDLGYGSLTSEQVKKLAKSQRPLDRVKAAMSEESPVETLAQLAEDSSSGVRFAVGLNAKTPVEVLSKLASDPVQDVQLAVFGNPTAPTSVRNLAMNSEDEQIRARVALNPRAASQELELLAEDKSEVVRVAVAKNESCNAEILARLAKDKADDVRDAVAENPNTDESTLKLLTKDKYYLVRLSLAYRDDLTDELREILSKDKEKSVREALDSDF
jgi:hypothetical protein